MQKLMELTTSDLRQLSDKIMPLHKRSNEIPRYHDSYVLISLYFHFLTLKNLN